MTRMTRIGTLLAAAVLASAGCSTSNGLTPVRGTVTYKGAPVAGAMVLFMGDETTKPATAVSESDGSYSLMTLDAAGAMPGKYAVVVTKSSAPAGAGEPPSMEEAAKMAGRPPPAVKELLPAKYGDATRTPLQCEVTAGKTVTFDISLVD